jgi:PAS domain S-box-containing protein
VTSLQYIGVAWITEGTKSVYVGDGIEQLIGWTAEEVIAMSFDELFASSTLKFFREHYVEGTPGSIATCAFASYLRHKDGHTICCRTSLVCRYNGDGHIAEAYGSIRSQPSQCIQNELLECWPHLENEDVAVLDRLVGTYAA